jgi:hypothetical protein
MQDWLSDSLYDQTARMWSTPLQTRHTVIDFISNMIEWWLLL